MIEPILYHQVGLHYGWIPPNIAACKYISNSSPKWCAHYPYLLDSALASTTYRTMLWRPCVRSSRASSEQWLIREPCTSLKIPSGTPVGHPCSRRYSKDVPSAYPQSTMSQTLRPRSETLCSSSPNSPILGLCISERSDCCREKGSPPASLDSSNLRLDPTRSSTRKALSLADNSIAPLNQIPNLLRPFERTLTYLHFRTKWDDLRILGK